MYKIRRELRIIILALFIDMFSGRLFRLLLEPIVESDLICVRLGSLMGAIAASTVIYMGCRKRILSPINIDFDDIKFSTVYKSLFITSLAVCFSFILGVILSCFCDSQWIFQSNISSDNEILSLTEKIAYMLASCIGAPLIEELIFRGALINVLRRIFDIKVAVIISVVIFGLLHGTSLMVIVNAMAVGIALSYIYVSTNNLAYTIFLHSVLNIAVCLKSFGL